MKKAFTLIEVSILLVIFVMVAVLVIPLSVDDTLQARHIAKWKQVQNSFAQIPIAIEVINNHEMSKENFISSFERVLPLNKLVSYKIKYMNGETPKEPYVFNEIYATQMGATVAYNWFDKDEIKDDLIGTIMYDVNGKRGPNVWGKDIFGFNIYKNVIMPIGANLDNDEIEFDCSRQGTGLYCSAYYLQGGKF